MMATTKHRGGRLLTGPEATRALAGMESRQTNQDLWPYPWSFPPPGSKRRTPQGSVAMPAAATPTTVLAFKVPTNFTFVWTAVMFDLVAGAWVPGSGDALLSITLDTPTSGGAPLTNLTLADFGSMSLPLGSLRPFSLFPLPQPETIASGQTLRAVVTNVNLAAGAPNFAAAFFLGWLVAAEI